MIQLIASEHDDAEFLALVQRILNGAIAALTGREVYLVQIDNWFDHKWLGWRSRWSHKKVESLRVPLFTPNRVRSEKHFVWDLETSVWNSVGMPTPLHVLQAGRSSLARPLDQFSKSAAFAWYSGHTTNNRVGSLMFYLSGADGYAWYAAFKKGKDWTIADECHTTRRELKSFEEHGRQMELAQV